MDQKLYNDLARLRQKLKDYGKTTQGRTPLVCNDEALVEIARLCPKKLSDFESVPGIGKSFIENYGEAFLAVINKHQQVPAEKTVSVSGTAASTLKELEKKLVSINRRNRLLYMPKLASKYGYDLFHPSVNYVDSILFGNGKPITICDLSNAVSGKEQIESSNYKKIVTLLREINKDLRDKGQNDLYIGYPFVIGRLPRENFDVRAPLALIPVIAERATTRIQLIIDDSRDVIYNNTLVLANFKFNNISKPLPADTIDQFSRANFFKELIAFYAENEISIQNDNTEYCKFKEYAASEFPSFRSGELKIENCAILGKFPIRSSALQKDFDEILKKVNWRLF